MCPPGDFGTASYGCRLSPRARGSSVVELVLSPIRPFAESTLSERLLRGVYPEPEVRFFTSFRMTGGEGLPQDARNEGLVMTGSERLGSAGSQGLRMPDGMADQSSRH